MVLYPNKLPESERVCSGICIGSLQKSSGIRLVGLRLLYRYGWNLGLKKRIIYTFYLVECMVSSDINFFSLDLSIPFR